MSKPVRVEVVMDDGSRRVVDEHNAWLVWDFVRAACPHITMPAPPKVGDRVVINGEVGQLIQVDDPRPRHVVVLTAAGHRTGWLDSLSPAPPEGDGG